MEYRSLPIFDISIDPLSKELQLTNIDAVTNGAIERSFITQTESDKKLFTFQNNFEERITTGPVMIPDRLIYRYDEVLGLEYYIRINSVQIKNAIKSFFLNKNQSNFQINHEGDLINGVHVIQSWWVEDVLMDKSAYLGFRDIPVGAWFASHWFENQAVWDNYIKTGRLRDYSIQGYFQYQFFKNIEIPLQMQLHAQKAQLHAQIIGLSNNLKKYTI